MSKSMKKKSQVHEQKVVDVDHLLNPRDVQRMAKAAIPTISLSHTSTKNKKIAEMVVVKSKIVENKNEDGTYPDAYFLTGSKPPQEVSEEYAMNHPDDCTKMLEPVYRVEEILCGPVQEELYDFLRKFVGHIISETTGRNGLNDIITTNITRAQVVEALRELRFDFANFYASRNYRSKRRSGGANPGYAGAINMVAFRKMLNHAVEKAISDRNVSFRSEGKHKVTFSPDAVDEIKLLTEQRISSLFLSASTYAGGRRVNVHHFLLAKGYPQLDWDVVRGGNGGNA